MVKTDCGVKSHFLLKLPNLHYYLRFLFTLLFFDDNDDDDQQKSTDTNVQPHGGTLLVIELFGNFVSSEN